MRELFLYSCSALLLMSLIHFQQTSSEEFNKTISLVISSRKNQTGHLVSQASVSTEGSNLSDQWKLNILQSNTKYAGIPSFKLIATFVAPPPIPVSYELFPGVGYYKFHSEAADGFEDASSKCASEGGHLVIVNSESEHQVMQTIFARYPQSELEAKVDYAYAGFHDRQREGEFFTIFGQPLQSSGFTRWSHPSQPDDYLKNEDCGSINRNGGLNDIPCEIKLPFICEYDLSWTEN